MLLEKRAFEIERSVRLQRLLMMELHKQNKRKWGKILSSPKALFAGLVAGFVLGSPTRKALSNMLGTQLLSLFSLFALKQGKRYIDNKVHSEPQTRSNEDEN